MILDSRIKAGKKPLTCFDTEEASKFVNEKGYFSDCLYNFQNLDNCSKSILHCIDDKSEDSKDYIFNDGKYYCRFFLPEEWTDQKNKINFEQYRLETFKQEFNIGDVVTFKGKSNTDRVGSYYECFYSGYRIMAEKGYTNIIVNLGLWGFTFSELFDFYEIKRGENWEPFGRKVETIDLNII